MYISNSNNIGMATLLQNNKNCMKSLSNGTSVVGVGSAGTNHIIVGNVVNSTTVGQQSNHQLGIVTSTNVTTQTVSTSTQGGLGGSNTITALGGNLVLPAQTQTILLTNGATGASTILTYQQYQQLLQQQQQQQQQRLLVSQNLVNLPIGNIINAGNSGLTVITDSSNHNAPTSGNTATTQGTILVATSSAAPTIASSSATSFQQQFQQQLTNLQNSQSVTSTSSSTTLTTPSTSYLQQSGGQQQRLISTTAVGNVGNNNSNSSNTTTIRHFSQFSQQQPTNTLNILTNTSATPNNSNNQQQQQRTTTVLINRNNNTIIAGNTTQRLQHATILTKSPANLIKTTQPHQQGTIMVNNMAVQQVINNSNGQIISLVKSTHQQQQQQVNRNLTQKSIQQSTTANLPQQFQKQRYGTTNIQQIKQQQLKVVTANNHQTIPQRATIINSNAITKNHVLSTNNNTTTKLVNLNKTTTAAAAIINTNKNISSNSLSTVSQKQTTQQQQQINGHLNHRLTTTLQQQQPASRLVPNGHNINKNNITNKTFVSSSASSSSNSIITSTSSLSNAPTIYNTTTTSSVSALANPNTSYMPKTQINFQEQYTTSTLNSTAGPTTTADNPSNPSTADSKSVSVASTEEASITTNAAISNSSTAAPSIDSTTAATVTAPASEQQEPEPEIDIVINNVVCSFSVRCHLNLREIALNGANVEYRRENGMVTMKLRRPYTTASIWSSGRITCTGATSEEQAKIAARRYARCLEKLGFRARFHNFRVVNVLGTCSMPWAIKIVNFSEKYREEASYEPELHPGVTYKLRYPKATLKIFSTGSITVTAASVAHVQCAIEHIFPLVYEFRKKRSPEELEQLRLKQLQNATFEDITEVEDVVVARSGGTVLASSTGGSVVPTVSTVQRRRISNTFNKFSNAKRKRIDDVNEEFNADDPEIIAGAEDEDDMVMYDPNESIIECPDDEDDL